MKYQRLGKTHKVNLILADVGIIYLVAFFAGLILSLLIWIYVNPGPFWAVFSVSVGSGLAVAKISEVPFCSEILRHRLKGRVSFER